MIIIAIFLVANFVFSSTTEGQVFPIKMKDYTVVPGIISIPVNAFMIRGFDGSNVLYDCGQPEDYDIIRKIFMENEIRYIVISHAHGDHLGCVAKLKEEFPEHNFQTISHAHEAEDIRLGRFSKSNFYGTFARIFFVPLFFIFEKIFDPLNKTVLKSSIAFEPDILFFSKTDNSWKKVAEELMENYSLEIFETSGHTEGSISAYIHNSGEVIIGDLISRQYFSDQIGYHVLVNDIEDLKRSFKKIFSFHPRKIYGCHINGDTTSEIIIEKLKLNKNQLFGDET